MTQGSRTENLFDWIKFFSKVKLNSELDSNIFVDFMYESNIKLFESNLDVEFRKS